MLCVVDFCIGVLILSDRVKQFNKQARFVVDEDSWTPNQPQHFIPLLLIHHHHEHTVEQATALQLAKVV